MDIWLGQLDEVNDSQKWHAMEWQREWEWEGEREWNIGMGMSEEGETGAGLNNQKREPHGKRFAKLHYLIILFSRFLLHLTLCPSLTPASTLSSVPYYLPHFSWLFLVFCLRFVLIKIDKCKGFARQTAPETKRDRDEKEGERESEFKAAVCQIVIYCQVEILFHASTN